VFAYTAQYGNGFSATFSFEEPRVIGAAPLNGGVVNTQLGNPLLGTTFDTDKAKIRFPDIVQNWRVDQAWGSAQLMVAAHDVSGAYYAANNAVAAVAGTVGQAAGSSCVFAANGVGTITGAETCGHPADKLGWAVGGGAKLNAQGGDYFQFQVNYTQGASRYSANTIPGSFGGVNQWNGASLGYGFFTDGVFSTQTGDVQLTTTIGVNAAYDHLWTPQLRTSIYGSWLQNRYSDAANLALCNAQTNPAAGAVAFVGPVGPAAGVIPGTSGFGTCSNNWNLWTVGSRSQYNFTPWFYVGFDVIYSKIETASNGAIVTYTALGGTAKPTALLGITNQDNYGLRIRVHRDIVP
jgi:Porin subfamily